MKAKHAACNKLLQLSTAIAAKNAIGETDKIWADSWAARAAQGIEENGEHLQALLELEVAGHHYHVQQANKLLAGNNS